MKKQIAVIPFLFMLFFVPNTHSATGSVLSGIECKVDNPSIVDDLFIIRLEKGAVPESPNFWVLSKIRQVYVGEEVLRLVEETEVIAYELLCAQKGLNAFCREASTDADVDIRSGSLKQMRYFGRQAKLVTTNVVQIDVIQFGSNSLGNWEFKQRQCKPIYK